MKRYKTGLRMAFTRFSTIPFRTMTWDDGCKGEMLALFPLVGVVCGLVWWGGCLLLERLGIPNGLFAAAATLLPYLTVGLIHLDGYMDTCDAILSFRPLQERLRIMKDPHPGAFAVISVVLLMIVSYGASSALMGKEMIALIFVPATARACAALYMLRGTPLAHSAYTKGTIRKKGPTVVAAALLALFCAVSALASWRALAVQGITVAVAAVCFERCRRMFGGVSGDISGFAVSMAQVAGLVAAVL